MKLNNIEPLKISDLMKIMNEAKEKHGDIPVVDSMFIPLMGFSVNALSCKCHGGQLVLVALNVVEAIDNMQQAKEDGTPINNIDTKTH